uniref:Uncharacterized protein n=1 Tax=Arundo donax TaxID=35708 RepID=A0A0A8XVV3_ARUDO
MVGKIWGLQKNYSYMNRELKRGLTACMEHGSMHARTEIKGS